MGLNNHSLNWRETTMQKWTASVVVASEKVLKTLAHKAMKLHGKSDKPRCSILGGREPFDNFPPLKKGKNENIQNISRTLKVSYDAAAKHNILINNF